MNIFPDTNNLSQAGGIVRPVNVDLLNREIANVIKHLEILSAKKSHQIPSKSERKPKKDNLFPGEYKSIQPKKYQISHSNNGGKNIQSKKAVQNHATVENPNQASSDTEVNIKITPRSKKHSENPNCSNAFNNLRDPTQDTETNGQQDIIISKSRKVRNIFAEAEKELSSSNFNNILHDIENETQSFKVPAFGNI